MLPKTRIYSLAKQFVEGERRPSDDEQPEIQDEGEKFFPEEEPKPNIFGSNVDTLEAAWRVHSSLLPGGEEKNGFCSLDCWAIRDAIDSLKKLASSRNALDDEMVAADCDTLGHVMENRAQLRQILAHWQGLSSADFAKAFAQKKVYGQQDVCLQFALGDDIKGRFVHALSAVVNTLDELEALGVTAEAMKAVAQEKRESYALLQ